MSDERMSEFPALQKTYGTGTYLPSTGTYGTGTLRKEYRYRRTSTIFWGKISTI